MKKKRKCDNCWREIDRTGPYGPRNEYNLVNESYLTLSGGYNSFFDLMPWEDPEEGLMPGEIGLILCHDCTARLFRMFPIIASMAGGRALHGYEERGKPCCEFGWTSVENEEGEWDGTIERGDGVIVPGKNS